MHDVCKPSSISCRISTAPEPRPSPAPRAPCARSAASPSARLRAVVPRPLGPSRSGRAPPSRASLSVSFCHGPRAPRVRVLRAAHHAPLYAGAHASCLLPPRWGGAALPPPRLSAPEPARGGQRVPPVATTGGLLARRGPPRYPQMLAVRPLLLVRPPRRSMCSLSTTLRRQPRRALWSDFDPLPTEPADAGFSVCDAKNNWVWPTAPELFPRINLF